MDFQPVRAEDKDIFEKYIRQMDSRSCDMTFATVYLWRDYYKPEYALADDLLVVRSDTDRQSYSFPIGSADPKRLIDGLKEHCRKQGVPLRLHNVYEKEVEYLEKNYPGEFEIHYERDSADYVYNVEDLIELRGKRYHGKKNHINKFVKNHDWVYEKITDDNVDECLAMLEEWKKVNDTASNPEMEVEAEVCAQALKNLEFLEMQGGLIRADGRIVAFSIGEKLNSDTYDIHYEKAFPDVQGAYAIINQQMLIHEAQPQGCTYVNREEDTGDEGLRKAKESYHPVFMVEKAFATQIV